MKQQLKIDSYLLNHHGEPNPWKSDLAPDQPWKRNRRLAAKLRADWTGGIIDPAATRDMLATLRSGSSEDCCDQVVELINRGVHPQSVWDALLLGGGELLFRQRGIVALHSLTTGNALHFAYQTSSNDDTRRMMLLQCAAFVPLFRDALSGRGKVRDFTIDTLEPAPIEAQAGPEMVVEVFAQLSQNRDTAAKQVLGALQQNRVQAQQVIDAGRLLVFLKQSGSHDYKFSSAVMEDYYHVSPAWRAHFLAAGVYNLRGAADRDSGLVKRTQAALA